MSIPDTHEHEKLKIQTQLIGALLNEESQSEGLKEFKKLFYNDFMTFANEESALANEAEVILQLQEIERDLELISAYPSLHTKNVIAVGGGFSAGKSEFISSFITGGVKLPIGVVPTTAIPSYVLHNDENEFIACNTKGGIVNLSEIDPNFHTKLSHDFLKSFNFNLKKIMPYMILGTNIQYKNICFVDTPGYNPADASDSYTSDDVKTAKEFLDNSNVFLWLIGLDSNGTISSNDLEFLSTLDLEDKKLYIVLNKADLRPLDEIEDVLEEVVESLDDYDIKYEGISAYSSLTQEEYTHQDISLQDYLQSHNVVAPKHYEILQRVQQVYLAYKDALLKEIEHKKGISKVLKSISFDILEDNLDESVAFEKLEELKSHFSTQEEENFLKQLDNIFISFKDIVDKIFESHSTFDMSLENNVLEDLEVDSSYEDIQEEDEDSDIIVDTVIQEPLFITKKTYLMGSIELYKDIIVEEEGHLIIFEAQVKASEDSHIISHGLLQAMDSSFSSIGSTWGNLTSLGEDSIIENCTFENGRGILISKIYDINHDDDVAIGGALYIRNNCFAKNCTITNCNADDLGGAICATDNTSIDNCTMTDCISNVGGGIASMDTSKINNCTITNCNADSFGGGINASDTVIIDNCDIRGCRSEFDSGIFSGESVIVQNCIIEN